MTGRPAPQDTPLQHLREAEVYHFLMRTFRATTLLVAILPALLPLRAAIPETIHVEQGQLTGVAGNDASVRVFKGIPFAAPPVGDLRWRGPKAAAVWTGVKAADKFGPQ